MSFILEALKKSENKRRDNNSPSAQTIHTAEKEVALKSKKWIIYIVVSTVIGGAIFLWFYNSKPQKQVKTTTPATMNTPIAAKVKSHDVAPTVATPRVIKTPPFKTEPKKQTQVTATTESTLQPIRNENKIYRLNQLPISIQNRIPALKMSLHAFARNNSSASMVQFNDRIMHEGDDVTNNIKLEQITAAGAILRYDGYLFMVPRRKN